VELVDEEDHLARGGGDLLQHGLEPLLELAAELGAGDQRTKVERHQALVLQALRHVAIDDAQRQAFDDGGLADAGLADQHGIVLGAPRQDLDGAADLLVAPDDGVELAVARGLGQVAGIFLERFIAVLGRGAVRLAALPQLGDGLLQRLGRDVETFQDRGRGRSRRERQRLQHALGGDEAVAGLLRERGRAVEEARGFRRQVNLPRTAAFHLGQLGQLGFGFFQRANGVAAAGANEIGGEAFAVIEQHLEQMLRRETLMAAAQSETLRGLNESADSLREFFEFHFFPALSRPCPVCPAHGEGCEFPSGTLGPRLVSPAPSGPTEIWAVPPMTQEG
jgi:hypothetical protein